MRECSAVRGKSAAERVSGSQDCSTGVLIRYKVDLVKSRTNQRMRGRESGDSVPADATSDIIYDSNL